MPAVRPAIYVASLNDYNSGILHGAWIDATLPREQIEREIADVLATSPTALLTGEPAEEWAIHDHEGFIRPMDSHEAAADIAAAAQLTVRFRS
jgi:antirestriction protein